MKKLYIFLVTLVVLGLAAGILLGGCTSTAASTSTPASTSGDKLKIVTGSSLLAYIAQQVGGDRVEVVNLIPATQHPGDFNVKPGDIQALSKAKLFLLHGWPGEGYVDQLVASANNPNLTVVKANVDGNWMIPSVQSTATDRIATILSQADSKNAAAYQNAATAYKKTIQSTESSTKTKLANAGVSKVNIMASVRQADFLQWAGFNLVASYGDPDSLTPAVVKDLVDQGQASQVTLVVDNLQSGQDAGKGMAEELKAKDINLSNFPGGFDNTETWEKAINYNVQLLMSAMGK